MYFAGQAWPKTFYNDIQVLHYLNFKKRHDEKKRGEGWDLKGVEIVIKSIQNEMQREKSNKNEWLKDFWNNIKWFNICNKSASKRKEPEKYLKK